MPTLDHSRHSLRILFGVELEPEPTMTMLVLPLTLFRKEITVPLKARVANREDALSAADVQMAGYSDDELLLMAAAVSDSDN
jgi:hypothetical protein